MPLRPLHYFTSLAWLAISVAGLWVLLRYEHIPGATDSIPTELPSGVGIQPVANEPTLIMFAHPKCPCTRASFAELERIVAQSGRALQPWIVFFRPPTEKSGWEQTDLWHAAQAIPGARILLDVDGKMARRFHVTTSGQTLLYSASGKLLFSGGITDSRGHQGDNAGEAAVGALLSGAAANCKSTPVFGCPILVSPTR